LEIVAYVVIGIIDFFIIFGFVVSVVAPEVFEKPTSHVSHGGGDIAFVGIHGGGGGDGDGD